MRYRRLGQSRAIALVTLLSLLTAANICPVEAQGFQDLLGVIRMGVAQQTWTKLGDRQLLCIDEKLRPQGQSWQLLANRGIPATDPGIQSFIIECKQAQDAWRTMDANTKNCISKLLQTNNQSVSYLEQLGITPSNPQVQPLITQCQQIEGARKAWVTLDPYVNACIDRFLKNGGQSVDAIASQGIAPSDPQAAPVLAKCQVISSQNLMKNVSCSVEGYPSHCDEYYVLATAQTSPLSVDDLVTAVVTGQSVGTAQIETAPAKANRIAVLAERRKSALADITLKKLVVLIDPSNKFAYARASELRKKIQVERDNPRFSEDDLGKLDNSVNVLLAENGAESERQRILREEMLRRGEVSISGEGVGPTQKAAAINAYYQVFERQLREYVSGQADGNLGQKFKKLANEDFNEFKSEFFIGTKDVCRKAGHDFSCSIVGVFKVASLKSEVQRIMSTTLAASSRKQRFILAYPETDDDYTRFLVDNIRAEFVNSGFNVVAKGAEAQAELSGNFDYYLNILDISYSNDKPDIGSVGGAGASTFENYILKARVKLLDNKKDVSLRQELANVSVINVKRVPRDSQMPREARREQLLPAQAGEAAKEIYSKINDRLLTLAGSGEGHENGLKSVGVVGRYSIRIVGLPQWDREKIRALRTAITKVLPGTEITVDPNATNDHSVQVYFDHPEKFDPEDLVDALYASFKESKKTFRIKYEGANSFEGSL